MGEKSLLPYSYLTEYFESFLSMRRERWLTTFAVGLFCLISPVAFLHYGKNFDSTQKILDTIQRPRTRVTFSVILLYVWPRTRRVAKRILEEW